MQGFGSGDVRWDVHAHGHADSVGTPAVGHRSCIKRRRYHILGHGHRSVTKYRGAVRLPRTKTMALFGHRVSFDGLKTKITSATMPRKETAGRTSTSAGCQPPGRSESSQTLDLTRLRCMSGEPRIKHAGKLAAGSANPPTCTVSWPAYCPGTAAGKGGVDFSSNLVSLTIRDII